MEAVPPLDNVSLIETSSARPKIDVENRARDYSRIRILIISWHDHDCDAASMKKQLNDVYNHFHFYLGAHECERWAIPGMQMKDGKLQDISQSLVQERLIQFKEKYGGDDKELLIIYYTGHGGWWDSTFHWGPRSTSHQLVEWTSIQWDCMLQGDNDAVMILDCCNSGGALEGLPSTSKTARRQPLYRGLSRFLRVVLRRQSRKHPQYYKKENAMASKGILAACSKEATTYLAGEHSFTARWLLAGRFKEPFTLDEWYKRTHRLSSLDGSVLPMYKFIGDGRRRIWFKPASLGQEDNQTFEN